MQSPGEDRGGVLAQLWQKLVGAATRTTERDERAEPEPAGPELGVPYDSWEEFTTETGRPKEEFLLLVIEANGGRIRQQGLVAETTWSSTSISRTLARLEEREAVVRRKVGREKVVLLPEAAEKMSA